MRHIRRALLGLLAILPAVGVVGAAVVLGSLPRHAGTLHVPGIQADVAIERDAYGVPYIRASSETDAYFALGFVHAQDRLWQLEFRRRVTQGRLAELIGAAGLPVDRFMRLLRVHALAAASLDAMAPRHRALVAAYTAGINAFLSERRRLLPPEFWLLWHRPEPWQNADSVAWIKLMALDLAGNWRRELLRVELARALPPDRYRDLFPNEVHPSDASLARLGEDLGTLDLSALARMVGSPAPAGHGSNAWVLAGSRTRTQAPLLANDPHLRFSQPGTWYLAGLEAPTVRAIGATLPGLPVVVLGRTDQIAWGMTNTGSDVQDLVIEDIVGPSGDATRTAAGVAPIVRYTTTIRCRFCPDEAFTARWSVNGPIVSDLVDGARREAGEERALTLRWAALRRDDTTLAAGFDVPLATTWASFNAALEPFANPQQNVFFADRAGHIGLVAAGRVPIRRTGDGTLPVRGWEPDGDWLGFIPFADLPRADNPATGWLANANNAVAGADYPYLLSKRWDVPWRYRRIVDRIEADLHDSDTADALQLDRRSNAAAALLPLFLDATATTPEATSWLRRLRGWDHEATASSVEQTVFAAWYAAVPEHLYADELGPLFERYGRQRPGFIALALSERTGWCDDVRTPAAEVCADILGRALDTALERLTSELGTESAAWAWGAQHPLIFEHDLWGRLGPLAPLATTQLPGIGDETSVHATSYLMADKPPLFPSRHGASYRQIVDLAAPERSRFATPTGQVGHPASRLYRNLEKTWAAGATLPMRPPAEPATTLALRPK